MHNSAAFSYDNMDSRGMLLDPKQYILSCLRLLFIHLHLGIPKATFVVWQLHHKCCIFPFLGLVYIVIRIVWPLWWISFTRGVHFPVLYRSRIFGQLYKIWLWHLFRGLQWTTVGADCRVCVYLISISGRSLDMKNHCLCPDLRI